MSEIRWSLMHPTPLDAEYMRLVVQKAEESPVKVDSFEICAECHGLLGGLDGLCFYDRYPALIRDNAAVVENIAKLREILDIAHRSGRPVYYWHREVTVPDGLVKLIPELLDEKGEFDLSGDAFEHLLRYKLEQAFSNVPELDGIVLTLTEADYSAIHNSTPEIYPPEQVVAKVAGIFAEELQKRGKRFILRSFGSIAKDYEDILAGAAILEKKGYSFEIETKITPYDFNPFLPKNPFLKHTGKLSLGAECDSLGEFFGAGYLPAENTKNIVRWVRDAQDANVDRFIIRCDRVGNNVFTQYPLNLYAYMRAISDKNITDIQIEQEYFSGYPSDIREQMLKLSRIGLESILKTNYVNGNLIFHQFPPAVSFKYLKAGGFFGCFKEQAPLSALSGIWSILSTEKNSTHEELLKEKKTAVQLSQEGCRIVDSLYGKIQETEYLRLKKLWNNLRCAAECLYAFCSCTVAYFKDMERGSETHPNLSEAIKTAEKVFSQYAGNTQTVKQDHFVNGMERNLHIRHTDIVNIYPGPLRGMLRLLLEEYDAERSARKRYQFADDLFIPGSLTDEWRCERAMHGCHATLRNGQPCRIIGNQVFPNGTLGFVLSGKQEYSTICLSGQGKVKISVNGKEFITELSQETMLEVEPGKHFHIILQGSSGEYPELFAAGLLRDR